MSYKEYPDHETWVRSFDNRIGASEIAIICGFANYKSPVDLWKEKTGRKKADDISDDELVSYGKEAEQYLRALFALKHRHKFDVGYHPYRVYYNDETPYLTATLDGELTEKETNRKGIYECKTCLIQSRTALEEWQNNNIPQKYYCQICQQLYTTNYYYAVLNAELRHTDGSAEIREYHIERADIEDDIAYVVSKGVEFWNNYVKTDKAPPVTIRI